MASVIPLLSVGWRQRRAWIGLSTVVLVVLALWLAVDLATTEGNVCLRGPANDTVSMTVRLPAVLNIATNVALDLTGAESSEERGDTASDWANAISLRGRDRIASKLALRLVMVKCVLQLVKEHPLVGVGSGTMHLYVRELTDQKASIAAHNTFLTLWAETGTLGVLFFLGAILLSFLNSLGNYRQAHTPFERAVSLGLLSALFGLLVVGLTHDVQRQRLLWLLMAMIFAQKGRLKNLSGLVEPTDGGAALERTRGQMPWVGYALAASVQPGTVNRVFLDGEHTL